MVVHDHATHGDVIAIDECVLQFLSVQNDTDGVLKADFAIGDPNYVQQYFDDDVWFSCSVVDIRYSSRGYYRLSKDFFHH